MSGLKQLRSRIKSVTSTKKITKAMQLVSASKLKKARIHLKEAEDYLKSIVKVMNAIAMDKYLLESLTLDKNFFIEDLTKTKLLILITSERGLCGAFNTSIIKQVKQKIIDLEQRNQKVKLIIVGKKGYEALKYKYSEYIDSYFHIARDTSDLILYKLQQQVINLVKSNTIGGCYLFFNHFQNAMLYKTTESQVTPIISQTSQDINNYEYEGSKCISNAIALYISGQLKSAIRHSQASEEGSRMTAMDSATKNANKLVQGLTLKYNRTRQSIITKELVEIISGAEAV